MPKARKPLSRFRRILKAKVSSAIFHIGPVSLRGRLTLVFITFLTVWFLIGSWVLLSQAYKSEQFSVLTKNTSAEAVEMIKARELLRSVRRTAAVGSFDSQEFKIIEDIGYHLKPLSELAAGLPEGSISADLRRLRASFTSDPVPELKMIDAIYQGLMLKFDKIIESDQEQISASALKNRDEQSGFIKFGVTLLTLFFLLSLVLVAKAIAFIGRPIASIERFIREIDLDRNLAPHSPEFGSAELPELSGLKRTLDEFINKMSGHHSMNVHNFFLEKKRADLIASSISDGILLFSGQTIDYANAVGERLLGFSPGSLVPGLKITTLIRKNSDEELAPDSPSARGAQAILSAISRSIPVEYTFTGNDRQYHYLIHAKAIVSEDPLRKDPEPDKSESAILVVAQDVTLLKESQEAKGHFLATLSHEIKTPVTSLTMATRLLKRSSHQIENPTLQSLITTCADDVDRLRALLTDLLSISGFDTLTQRLAVQNVDLGRLIKHSVHSFKADALERGIELKCEIVLSERRPILVNVDPTKIAWAVSNLLTNALRHTSKDGLVTVTVNENDHWAEVRVRDTGPGIDKRRLGQIFEKFSSHYDIRVARTGGAGVGLAITREIVVAHHGRIWASSELGQGAEFCFTLPLIHNERKLTGESRDDQNKNSVGPSVMADEKGAMSGKTACS